MATADPAPIALTSKQRKHLRGLAHHLDPVVMIGKEGLSPSVLKAVDASLDVHELVKVRLLETCPVERAECATQLAQKLAAERVGEIGRVVIVYRKHPKKPKLVLPK